MPRFIDALELEATAWLDALADYRKSEVADPEKRTRAKIGLGVVGAFVRAKATAANERSNDLIERRLSLLEAPSGAPLPGERALSEKSADAN
jgi:hypothetical protein